MKKLFAVLAALFFVTAAYAQNSGTVTNHAFAIGKGPGVTGYTSLLCANGQIAIGSATDPTCRTVSGDGAISAAGVLTLSTVNANVGSFGSATSCAAFTVNAKGLTTAASQTTCTPAVGSITGLGTGVGAALAINVGSAGAPVVNGGALGTPSSGVGTNLTALNATQLTSGTLPAARTNGHMNGTATNDSAAAGEIGEFTSNTAGSVALTTNTPANGAQVSLTAGDWDLYCGGNFTGAASTVTSDVRLGLNTVSATLPASTPLQFFQYRSAGITDFIYAPIVGPVRVSLSGSQTWYCVGQATFITSTYNLAAVIRARRVR